VKFEIGRYFRVQLVPGDVSVVIPWANTAGWPVDLALYEGDMILCEAIGVRKRMGNGLWAYLRTERGEPVRFWVKVSSFHKPAGHWSQIPPLEVLALAAR
jgi:hypothetical protein